MRFVAVAGALALTWSVVGALVFLREPLPLAIALAGPLPCYLVGLFVWWHAPRHPVARRTLIASTLFAGLVGTAFLAAATDDTARFETLGAGWRVVLAGFMVTLVVVTVRLIALLPDGHYRFRHEKVLLRPLWLAIPLDLVVAANGWLAPSAPVPSGMWLFVLGPALLAVRYFLLPRPERRTLRWLLAMAVLIGATVLAPLVLAGLVSPGGAGGLPAFLALLPTVVVPIALVVAVVRYRMLGVDIELRRSTRYRFLWLVIALWHVGVVAALSLTASRFLPIGLVVLVTIAATLMVRPVRDRLLRAAERRIFGPRLSSYELLVHLGATLEQAFDPQALATQLAQGLRAALDARWTLVRLEPAGGPAVSSNDGDADGEAVLEVPIRYGEEVLGHLECGPRTEGRYTSSDVELCETLARQTALAVHNVGLTTELSARVDQVQRQAEELAASRTRIVHAQTTERRRIQRHLHDGIQQELVALVTKLRLARNQLERDPEQAAPLLRETQEDAYRAIEELREVARRIHPPELSDQGLGAAVRSVARRAPIPVTVIADEEVGRARFASDIEETAYYLASEALTNVLKHAAATAATIRLARQNGTLLVEVSDDGAGMPQEPSDGLGLTGLRDRVDAVGGRFEIISAPGTGTTVSARMPAAKGDDR